ncbi:class I SAM-dependent methyltransferase [Streptomyces sp. NBC_01410]|uniref:class I SAM-dependent methyltransferase n=1 Tax=Streptomyces sp. NBC_01410 TaxID=2903856 RepID=UPI0032522667
MTINRDARISASAERDGRTANMFLYEGGGEVRGYFAKRYHAVRVMIARRQLGSALMSSATAAPHGPVVELGAGGGRIVAGNRLMKLLGSRPVIYVDIDPSALGSAESGGRIRVCSDVAEGLPFRDASIAAVVMGELIEHIYDTRRLLEDCHRVLVPNGALIITTPNLAALQDRICFVAGRSPRHVNPLHRYLWLHIRPFTSHSLRSVLCKTGFDVIELKSNFVVWRRKSGHRLQSRSMARLLPGVGSILVVSARCVKPAGTGTNPMPHGPSTPEFSHEDNEEIT